MTEVTEPPTEPTPTETVEPAKPWGSDDQFDPEKAWKLIEGLRADKERLTARPTMTDEQRQQLAEYQTLVEASRSDQDRLRDEATRWQTEAEKWRTESVRSRVETLATADFADPSDAVSAIDPSRYLDAGGQIDEAAIKADLAEVLARKPHWRRPTEPSKARVPGPNMNQGSGGGGKAALDPRQEFAAILQGRLAGT